MSQQMVHPQMVPPQMVHAQMVPQMQGSYEDPNSEKLRNLMVNYIPTTVDEGQLRELFERYGPVEKVKIVCDRDTHQSRGYGFVLFQNPAHANQAIEELDGFSIMNKHLKVAIASPRERERNEERRKQQGKPPHHRPRQNQNQISYAGFQISDGQMPNVGMYPNPGFNYNHIPQPHNVMMNNPAQYQGFPQHQQ